MAIKIEKQAPGGKRAALSEVLPLDTPYVVQIFPIYSCNFKCNYCIFQLDKSHRGFISDKIIMDLGLYKKCIDNMTLFPDKIKVLRFVGIGEPLLHKRILDMIRYAGSANIANTIELLTNASLLTHDVSDEIIGSGLTRLVISIQGTSSQKYKEICGVNIDFNNLIKEIRYFFENKRGIHVYIKIVNSALEDNEDGEKFYSLFENICDSISIEHTVPIHAGINFDGIIKNFENPLTQFGQSVSEIKICPQPFFTMQINPDGKVVPCYSFEYPEIIGDCNKDSAYNIWIGEKFMAFRKKMLDGRFSVCDICASCKIMQYRISPEDNLDSAAGDLKKLY